MNIIDSIIAFFVNLFRQRVDQARYRAKGKLMSAQARAKSKAAASFNRAVDAPAKRVAGKIKPRKSR